MKKHYFLSLLPFLFLFQLGAQNYFPKGATWYFDIPPFVTQQYSYSFLESNGDTIINGDTLIQINQNYLLKQVGSKIFKFNACNSNYSLLYDFGVNNGDTLIIFPDLCNSSDSVILKVDSINTITINSNVLKHFFITQLNLPSNWNFNGNVIEGIGNITYLFPQSSLADPQIGPLRCYNDSVIGNYNTGLHNGICDTVFSVGIEEYNLVDNIKLFPNPTKGLIQIETKLTIESIDVYNIESKKIFETHSLLVDITKFPRGIYFLKIFSKQGIIHKRILKE